MRRKLIDHPKYWHYELIKVLEARDYTDQGIEWAQSLATLLMDGVS